MVVTWLHVASSRKNAHTPAHVHTGLLHKQGTQAMVSDCAHTHMCVLQTQGKCAQTHTCVCCRRKESVVTLPVDWILF